MRFLAQALVCACPQGEETALACKVRGQGSRLKLWSVLALKERRHGSWAHTQGLAIAHKETRQGIQLKSWPVLALKKRRHASQPGLSAHLQGEETREPRDRPWPSPTDVSAIQQANLTPKA